MTASERLTAYRRLAESNRAYVPPFSFGECRNGCARDEVLEGWGKARDATRLKGGVSIYVHVPFCRKRRCSFCMYSSSTKYDETDLARYSDFVSREFDAWRKMLLPPIRNFYVGGGTPSVYSARQLSALLSPFRRFDVEPLGERTCEMSPSTATEDHVAAIASCGFNGLSLGVQSFDTQVLKAVNRECSDKSHVAQLCTCARRLSFVDVNLDFMLGLPGTGELNLREAVDASRECGALSASFYYWRQTKVSRARLEWEFKVVCDEMNKCGWELVNGTLNTEHHLFFSPERRRDTLRFVTSSNCIDNEQVVGLGTHAHGFRPSLSYSCDPGNTYRVWSMSRDLQLKMAAANVLYYHNNVVDKQSFAHSFGVAFSDVFHDEISALRELNLIEESASEFRLVGRDDVDMVAAQKFFWDPFYLKRHYGVE